MFDICNDILYYTSWLTGFARASPSLLLPPHVLLLSTLPPSDYKASPRIFAVAQDNCIPEILFKTWCLVTLTFSPLTPPPHRMGWGGGAGANKKYRFSRQFMKCLRHLKFLPIKLPTPGGVGWDYFFVITLSRQFMTFPGLLIFWPSKIPTATPLVGGG